MNAFNIEFKVQTSSTDDILSHLQKVDAYFIPKLSDYVNLTNYSRKIHDLSQTFEAWNKGELVGLLAVYFNDITAGKGFITSVSVLPAFYGGGIARSLINMSIEYGKSKNFNSISLEVFTKNVKAISLYEKCGFCVKNRDGDKINMSLVLV